MLAQTLRVLEADGFVLRVAQPTIPPRVDYSLTDRGRELAGHLQPLVEWIADNADRDRVRRGRARLIAAVIGPAVVGPNERCTASGPVVGGL